MPKYNLYAKVAASKYLGEVEAATMEEAIQKGYDLDSCTVSVCHQCSRDVEDPEVDDVTAEKVSE